MRYGTTGVCVCVCVSSAKVKVKCNRFYVCVLFVTLAACTLRGVVVCFGRHEKATSLPVSRSIVGNLHIHVFLTTLAETHFVHTPYNHCTADRCAFCYGVTINYIRKSSTVHKNGPKPMELKCFSDHLLLRIAPVFASSAKKG